MAVDVTKIEFSGIYLPNKLGELGMKNVRLVAHMQTADQAILPALVASLEEQGANLDTTSDSDENLQKQVDIFKKILGDSKDGNLQLPLDDLNKILQPDKEKDSNDKAGSNPLNEINKILPPSGEGKNDDLESKSTTSEDKNIKPEKSDSNTSNGNEKPGRNQNNQTSDNAQPRDNNNPVMKNTTPDTSEDTTSDTKQSKGTTEEPVPTGDTNSGSANETKHGGLLDLLKKLFP
ncbi:hypothetical protein NSQ59_02895 [Margalitia sp. FSL K6-0131]